MIKKKKIRIDSIQTAKELVLLAGQCDFDIRIFYNQFIVDAKSILGVLSLDLAKDLTVEFDGNDRMLETFLDTVDAAKAVA